jgi:hypothetical protein
MVLVGFGVGNSWLGTSTDTSNHSPQATITMATTPNTIINLAVAMPSPQLHWSWQNALRRPNQPTARPAHCREHGDAGDALQEDDG